MNIENPPHLLLDSYLQSVEQSTMLRKPEIKAITGLNSDVSLFNQINEGLLPPYIKLGARAVGLQKFEVDAIIAARSANYSDDQIRELVVNIVKRRKSNAAAYSEVLSV